MAAARTAADIAVELDVSRETLARLERLVELLRKWNDRINLVSRRSLDDVWGRHILDSGQLLSCAPAQGPWLDLGSGAGFPGLVVAAMGAPDVRLVESDSRKCVFLREAARELDLAVQVHNERIERLAPQKARVISARALAPLPQLLDLAHRHAGPETVFLLPKGQDVEDELTQAAKSWRMCVERIASLSDPRGVVLRLKEVSHVAQPSPNG